jgi:surface protein
MFYGCSMANPDVSGFDTSQVTNMALMFYGCSVANPDVSGFNTSQVTTMDSMFRGCSVANPDVSGFDTSKVTNMAYMFSGATAWSTDNYNKAMLAWGKQNVTSGVVFDSYNRPIYTGLPETRKANLTAQGWTITDSGNTTGTGYFGIAVSTDGGSTWTPVTENTVTLYDNTSAGVQYIATDNVDREVTVRAYYTDNVTVLDETNDGYYYSVNLSHQAGSTVTSGTIIYDTGRPSLTGMEFSSTNPSATYTTEGSLLIISTGALTSGDTYTYSFTLPTYSVSGHIICDENSTSIPGADVVLNGFSATTNETGYFVFPSVTNGTYTITASKYGYYTGEQTISISGDDVENVNITMCQVKPATANETYLPWQIYGIFFAFSTLLVFYAFLHRDFENYTHVLSSFASGALNILLGYSTYIGIVFLNPTTYYYKSEIYAGFHIIWGGVMILLTVIYIIDIGKRTFIEKQVREEYELTGRR